MECMPWLILQRRVSHVPDVQIKQWSVCEGNEREGVHLQDRMVYQGKYHFNAEEKYPCRHDPVGDREWSPGGNKHPGKERLRNTNIEYRFNEIHGHDNIQ